MKKIILITLILMLCITSFTACANVEKNDETSQTTGIEVDDTVADELGGTKENMGGFIGCPVHDQAYHLFTSDLAEYIGEERFAEWVRMESDETLPEGCTEPKNLYNCIHYFEVPREELEEVYYNWKWYIDVWNFDALYSDDPTAADLFYRDSESNNEITEKRMSLLAMKTKIVRDHWDEWTALYGEVVPRPTQSVKYLVELFDVPREKIEEYVVQYSDTSIYDYDFDALYALVDGSITLDDPTPIKEDALFCGFDDLYIE